MDLDHIIFSTNFKIWFRKFKQTPSERKKYDWDKVVQKPVIRLQYQLELKNRFDALNEVEGPDTLDKKNCENSRSNYTKIDCNPPKRGPNKLVSDATLTLVVKRGIEKKRYHQKKTTATKERWKNLVKQVQESCLEYDRRFTEGQVAKLRKANQQRASRWTWKIMTNITGKSAPCSAVKLNKLTDEIEKLLQDLLGKWRKYFSNLLNAKLLPLLENYLQLNQISI